MKILLLAALLVVPIPSFAYTECAGDTPQGTLVKVTVYTVGALGSVASGSVYIEEKGKDPTYYTIQASEIPQFFENVSNDNTKAFVGLSAYVHQNFPIQFSYSGLNYQQDLATVLRTYGRKPQAGNYMRVWKGPGFASDQQYSFVDMVCSVTLDP